MLRGSNYPLTFKRHTDLFGVIQGSQKARFWTILTMLNIVAMNYPVTLYFHADNSDAQFVATIVFLGSAFLLAITDTVSAIVAYLQ